MYVKQDTKANNGRKPFSTDDTIIITNLRF